MKVLDNRIGTLRVGRIVMIVDGGVPQETEFPENRRQGGKYHRLRLLGRRFLKEIKSADPFQALGEGIPARLKLLRILPLGNIGQSFEYIDWGAVRVHPDGRGVMPKRADGLQIKVCPMPGNGNVSAPQECIVNVRPGSKIVIPVRGQPLSVVLGTEERVVQLYQGRRLEYRQNRVRVVFPDPRPIDVRKYL